jgi:hypothetical protein
MARMIVVTPWDSPAGSGVSGISLSRVKKLSFYERKQPQIIEALDGVLNELA